MGQNFFTLEYRVNAETHASREMKCFIHGKVNFEKKARFSPLRDFSFFAQTSDAIMLERLIIHFSLCYLSYFKLSALEEVAVANKRFQIIIVFWLEKVWYFLKLVARRGEVVA